MLLAPVLGPGAAQTQGAKQSARPLYFTRARVAQRRLHAVEAACSALLPGFNLFGACCVERLPNPGSMRRLCMPGDARGVAQGSLEFPAPTQDSAAPVLAGLPATRTSEITYGTYV